MDHSQVSCGNGLEDVYVSEMCIFLIGDDTHRQPMCDRERRSALNEVLQGLLDVLLGGCVQSADVRGVHERMMPYETQISHKPCGLVQKENGRIFQQRTCDSDTLLLAPTQPDTPLADLGLVPIREAQNAVVDLSRLRCCNDLFVARAELAIAVGSHLRQSLWYAETDVEH